MILSSLEEAKTLRGQLEREVEALILTHSTVQGQVSGRKPELRIFDLFRRIAREGQRVQEMVLQFEVAKGDKIDKLLGQVDGLKKSFTSENTRLKEQVESGLQGEILRKREVREKSRDIEASKVVREGSFYGNQSRTQTQDKFYDLEREREKKSSLDGKIATNDKYTVELGKELLDKVQTAIASVERYQEVCPPLNSEGHTVHKKLVYHLDAMLLTASTASATLASSFQNRRPNQEKLLQGSHIDAASLIQLNKTSPIVQNLQKLNEKLEKKCEDRKASMKKLYFLLTEKTRQLKEACQALEALKKGSQQIIQNAEESGLDWTQRLEDMEMRMADIASVIRSRVLVASAPLLTKSTVVGMSGILQAERTCQRHGDGSLEYSFTRRYDGLHKSGVDSRLDERDRRREGQNSDSRAMRINSHDSLVVANDKQIHLPQPDSREMRETQQFPELNDTIHQIIELAKEKFSYMDDEDPDDTMVTLMKIVRDWGYMLESYQQEKEDKENLLRDMDEREQMQASLMRDLKILRNDQLESTNEIDRLVKENNLLAQELTRLAEDNKLRINNKFNQSVDKTLENQQGQQSPTIASKSPPKGTPLQHSSSISPNTPKTGGSKIPTTIQSQTGIALPPLPALVSTSSQIHKSLISENEKLKDKLSMRTLSLHEKIGKLTDLKDAVTITRADLSKLESLLADDDKKKSEYFNDALQQIMFKQAEVSESSNNRAINLQVEQNELLKVRLEDTEQIVSEMEMMVVNKDEELFEINQKYHLISGQKEKVERDLDKLKKELEQQNSRLHETIGDQKVELTRLNDSLRTMGNKIQDMNAAIIRKDRRVLELETSLSSQLELTQKLEQAANLRDKKIVNMEGVVSTLTDKLAIKEIAQASTGNNSTNQINPKEDNLQEKDAEIASLKSTISLLEEELNNVRSEITLLSNSLEEKDLRVESLEQLLAVSEKDLNVMEQKLKEYIEQLENASKNEKALIETHQEEIANINEDIDKENAQIELLRNEIKDIYIKLEEKNVLLEALEKELLTRAGDLQEVNRKKEESETIIKDLETAAVEAAKREDNLKRQLANNTTDINRLTAELNESKEKVENVSIAKEEQEIRVEAAQKELEDKALEIEQLLEEIKVLKQNKTNVVRTGEYSSIVGATEPESDKSAMGRIANLHERVRELEEEVKEKNIEIENSEREFEGLLADKEELQEQLKEINEKLVRLSREKSLSVGKEETNQVEKEMVLLQKEVRMMKTRIEDYESEKRQAEAAYANEKHAKEIAEALLKNFEDRQELEAINQVEAIDEEELIVAKRKIEGIHNFATETEEKLNSTLTTLKEKEDLINALGLELENEKNMLAKVQEKLTATNKELELLTTSYNQEVIKTEDLQKSLFSLKTYCTESDTNLKQKVNELLVLKSELDNKDTTIKDLEKEVRILRDVKADMERERQALKENLNMIEGRYQNSTAELTNVKEEIKRIKTANNDLLQQVKIEAETYEKIVRDLRELLMENEQKLKTAEDQVSRINAVQNDTANKLKATHAKELDKVLREKEIEINTLTSSLAQVHTESNDNMKQILQDQANKHDQVMQNTKAIYDEYIQKLKRQIEELTASNKHIEGNLQKLKEEQAQEMAVLKSTFENDLETAKESIHTKEISNLKEKQQQELTIVEKEFEHRIDELRELHKDEIETKEAARSQALEDLEKKNTQTLNSLNTKHTLAMDKLKKTQDFETEELIARLNEERDREVGLLKVAFNTKEKRFQDDSNRLQSDLSIKIASLQQQISIVEESKELLQKKLIEAQDSLASAQLINTEENARLVDRVKQAEHKILLLQEAAKKDKEEYALDIQNMVTKHNHDHSKLLQEIELNEKKMKAIHENEINLLRALHDENMMQLEAEWIKQVAATREESNAALEHQKQQLESVISQERIAKDTLKSLVLAKERDLEEIKQKSVLEKSVLDMSAKKEFEKVLLTVRYKDDEIRSLNEKIQTLNRELSIHANQKQAFEVKILNLSNSLAIRESNLQDQASGFQEVLSEKTLELTRVTNSLAAITAEQSASQHEVKALRSENFDLVDRLKSASTEIAARNTKINSLEAQVKNLEASLQSTQSQIEEIQKKHDEDLEAIEDIYSKELSAAKEFLKQAELEVKGLQSDIQNKDLKLIMLSEEKSDKESRIEELQLDIVSLNTELQKKVGDINGVMKAKDQMILQAEIRASSKEKEAQDLSEKNLRLEKKLEAFNADIESKNNNIDTLGQNLNEMAAIVQERNEQIRSLDEELKQLKRTVRELYAQIEEVTDKSNKNYELSQNKSTYIEEVKKENEAHIEQVKILEAQLARETGTTSMINEKLAEANVAISSLIATQEMLKAKADSQSHELTSLLHSLHEAETSLALANTKIATLNESLKVSEQALEQSHLSSKKASSSQSESVEILTQSLVQERISNAKAISALKATQLSLEASLIREQQSRAFDRSQHEKREEELLVQLQTAVERDRSLVIKENEWIIREQQWVGVATQVEELHEENERLQQELDRATIERDGYKEEHTAVLFKLSETEKEISQLNSRLAESISLFDQLEVMKQQASSLTYNILEKDEEINTQERQIKEASLRIERLIQELVEVKEARNESDDKIRDNLERAFKAENELNTMLTERNRERNEKESVTAQLTQANQLIDSLKARDEEQQTRIRDMKSEIKKLNNTLDDLQLQYKNTSDNLAQTHAGLLAAKTEAEGFRSQHQDFLKREKEQGDKLKTALTTEILEKSELGGRVKELLSSVENYRLRYESEAQTRRDLASQIQSNAHTHNTLEEEIKRLKDTIAKQKQKKGDNGEKWRILFAKVKCSMYSRRLAVLLSVLKKARPLVGKVKKLEVENSKLLEDLITQTKKFINIEKSRSEMEGQLNQRESELDQVMMLGSKTNLNTLKSELDPSASARDLGVTGRSGIDNKVHALRLVLRDILSVLADLLKISVPPIDNLNDKLWDTFIPKMKNKIYDLVSNLEDANNAFETYKKLLDEQTIQNDDLKEKIRSLGLPEIDRSLSAILKEGVVIPDQAKSFESEVVQGFNQVCRCVGTQSCRCT